MTTNDSRSGESSTVVCTSSDKLERFLPLLRSALKTAHFQHFNNFPNLNNDVTDNMKKLFEKEHSYEKKFLS